MSRRIATSPLTGRIFMGRTNQSGSAFVGEKADVTSMVLGALIEKAEFHGGEFEIEGSDGSSWSVSVKRIEGGPR